MKLESEFYRLPLRFDVDRLKEEALQYQPEEWCPHPGLIPGNSSVPLITVNGTVNDEFNGPMKQTSLLARSPYIQQVIASFGEVFGRSRLMRLEGGAEVTKHSDLQYHWHTRVRIHVPIITNEKVIFHCDQKKVHMKAGEAWIFDAWKPHNVINRSHDFRIHLVIDTAGSSRFWDMVANLEHTAEGDQQAFLPDQQIEYVPGKEIEIMTENFNAPVVMSPGEVDALIMDLIEESSMALDNKPTDVEAYSNLLHRFRHDWRTIWLIHGQGASGFPHYKQLIEQSHAENMKLNQHIALCSNRSPAPRAFYLRILTAAFNPQLAV